MRFLKLFKICHLKLPRNENHKSETEFDFRRGTHIWKENQSWRLMSIKYVDLQSGIWNIFSRTRPTISCVGQNVQKIGQSAAAKMLDGSPCIYCQRCPLVKHSCQQATMMEVSPDVYYKDFIVMISWLSFKIAVVIIICILYLSKLSLYRVTLREKKHMCLLDRTMNHCFRIFLFMVFVWDFGYLKQFY